MVRLDGFVCFYCGLPVRFTGDHRHPGYVVIDHVGASQADLGGLPDLRVLHRFCSRALKTKPGGSRCSIVLRRAWLGWVTGEFEAQQCEKHYGIRHYERLGLHPGRLRVPALFRKYWQVRKMRCASRACRYYAIGRSSNTENHAA
jgi:hypothetical protein